MAPPPEDESGGAGVGRCCVGGARWVLLGLALGQFVSLLITSTGFASSELARRGAYRPYTHALTPPRTRLIWFTVHGRRRRRRRRRRGVLLTAGSHHDKSLDF